MAKQAHIVSFDEAKRTSASRRRGAATSAGSSSCAPRRSGGFADFDYTFSDEPPAPRSRGARRAESEAADASEQSAQASFRKESWFSKFKRDRAKGKAGRAFTRQYGDTSSSASQGGPRAAVYKGEMGSKHKRAARMQESSSAGASARRSAFGRGSALVSSPKFIAAAAVAACLVFSCVFLYPAARQFYVAAREGDRLQAEYEAVMQRNAAIQEEVDALNTSTGIEDRARDELGWSRIGEHAVSVQGLNLDESEQAFEANITSESIQLPETWYSKILDPLFGVE